MGNNHRKSVIAVAVEEYIGWITDARMLLVGVVFLFLYTLAITPLLEHAEKMGQPLHLAEPLIAVGNSNVLVMLIPMVFIVLLSDYPRITPNTLLVISRCGRGQWYVGQILFRFIAVVSYLGIMAVGSVCLSHGRVMGDWSEVVTKYNAIYPQEAESYASRLLPTNLYNQISLYGALFHTVVLLVLYLMFLSEVMYLFQLLNLQPYGLYAIMIVIMLGIVTCSLHLPGMWLFPLANTIVWLHYDAILSSAIVPVWQSYAYFFVAIVLCMAMNYGLTKRYQFVNTERIQ